MQDPALEVRTVVLANGQKASLILEGGRLQRIVAQNGQVAELRWHQPTHKAPVGGTDPKLPLKVKLRAAPPAPCGSFILLVS